jgi:hypothetical protein
MLVKIRARAAQVLLALVLFILGGPACLVRAETQPHDWEEEARWYPDANKLLDSGEARSLQFVVFLTLLGVMVGWLVFRCRQLRDR